MKTYTPKFDDTCRICVECPLCDGEWNVCTITQTKCPKHWTDDNLEDHWDFPDDCPAIEGVIIKREQ